ncbi:MAG: hypothetical protein H0Z24_08400 [Thermosipho sp. (in: Bacteria)]|nr:hypothetical protein [Thermosipho sp. (in: thermotogales)]
MKNKTFNKRHFKFLFSAILLFSIFIFVFHYLTYENNPTSNIKITAIFPQNNSSVYSKNVHISWEITNEKSQNLRYHFYISNQASFENYYTLYYPEFYFNGKPGETYFWKLEIFDDASNKKIFESDIYKFKILPTLELNIQKNYIPIKDGKVKLEWTDYNHNSNFEILIGNNENDLKTYAKNTKNHYIEIPIKILKNNSLIIIRSNDNKKIEKKVRYQFSDAVILIMKDDKKINKLNVYTTGKQKTDLYINKEEIISELINLLKDYYIEPIWAMNFKDNILTLNDNKKIKFYFTETEDGLKINGYEILEEKK